MTFAHCLKPCADCPWRLDVPSGQFPAQRFRSLVTTAVDTASTLFACHNTHGKKIAACAGFLLSADAQHNLSVRLAIGRGAYDPRRVSSPVELHKTYRRLAMANDVAGDDPVLSLLRKDCR